MASIRYNANILLKKLNFYEKYFLLVAEFTLLCWGKLSYVFQPKWATF